MTDFFKERKEAVKGFQDSVRSRTASEREIDVPEGLFEVCPKCDSHILKEDLCEANLVCTHCGHHFRMTARQRLASLVDENSFEEMDKDLSSCDPLNMPGYQERLA